MRRPFRDQGLERPEQPRDGRPVAPQGMQGRGRGFGPQAFDDAEGGQRPRTDEPQEFAPQRPRRGRVLVEPENERQGDELEPQPRPGFRRNAQ